MPVMTKRVNVKATTAVRNINPPIYGTVKNVVMTTGDILKCLCKRAQVEEILPNGTTVKLTMKNYFTDNGAGLFVQKPVVEPKKVEKKASEAPTVKAEAPVVETALNQNDEPKAPEAEPEMENQPVDDAEQKVEEPIVEEESDKDEKIDEQIEPADEVQTEEEPSDVELPKDEVPSTPAAPRKKTNKKKTTK